jgi:hypothetical protein
MNLPLLAFNAPAWAAISSRENETFIIELRNVPDGWWAMGGVVLLGLLLGCVVWMYRREGRLGASMRVRMILAALRCLVLLLLAVILLEPVRVKIIRRWIDSYAVVLVDESSSMDLADRYRDAATAERVRSVLPADTAGATQRRNIVERLLNADDRRFLRDLQNANRVKLYAFAEDASPVATLPALREVAATASPQRGTDAPGTLSDLKDLALEFPATGGATNLERALRRSVESLGSAPISGVVILTDGGINQGAQAEQLAEYARERQVPLHVVGIGDPSPPRNVRVAELLAPDNAFQQDPFAISATLTADGVEGESIRVNLRERSADGSGDQGGSLADEGRIVASRDVPVGPGGVIGSVTFQHRQEAVGRYTYSVEVPPVEDESVAEDNVRQATVNIIDSRTKVLLVAGSPSWDYRYVTTLLQRDDTIDVACWLQSADLSAVRDGDIIIDHLPTTAEELFEYDVILLLDPDKNDFDENWARLADTLVSEHGGGLLLAAARAHTPAFVRERALKPLHDLLPITFDPEADLVLNQIGHYQVSASPLEIPAPAYAHPVLRLSDDPVTTKLEWLGVGDVYWHYPVLREKPVATVLMRHGSPRMRNAFGGHVLAAVQFVGAGRTAFLGFDSTWRWRRFGVGLYDRFWVQLVRFLAEGKLLGGSKRATLLVENEHPTIGEAVSVSARLLDSRYEPLMDDEVSAQYRIEDQRTEFALSARRDRPGWFEGRFVPDRVGTYRIRLTLPGGAGGPLEVSRDVIVTRPNLEIVDPQMKKADLILLAEQSHGGRYWEIDEVRDLPAAIEDLHEEIPIRSRPTTLWDNGKVLALLVLLLCVEWAVRKWNRLL